MRGKELAEKLIIRRGRGAELRSNCLTNCDIVWVPEN